MSFAFQDFRFRLCISFFICADGKKTAFVGAVRLFWIAANRVVVYNFVKLKSVSPRQGNAPKGSLLRELSP